MDLNDLRSAVTLASFLAFLGILAWAWARQRRSAFEEAAALPFIDKDGELQ
jgi:cytochrome c oxidase cbb3-type subunit 4